MYGFPLTILEISHSILNFGDRYVIKYYLNAHELGLYSAAYTIAMEVIEVIDYPILSTVPVLYFELWNREGREGVQNLLRKGLKYYSLVVIPVMFGVIALSKELIIIIASNKYAGSAEIVPYITIGGVIFTSSTFFSAGLYIYKKSIIPSFIMMISASINMVLNFILVPRYGLMGSAVATLIGYTSYVIIVIPISFRYLSYIPDIKAMIRYGCYGTIMFIVINQLNISGLMTSFFIKIFIGSIIYLGFIFGLEGEIKEEVLGYLFRKNSKNKNSTFDIDQK
jgi:O-antigen/teichoic acid export membrane protein